MAEKNIAVNDVAEKTSTKDKIYVGAYVSRETHSKIVEIGKPRDLGISDIVREAVREYLAKYEKAEA